MSKKRSKDYIRLIADLKSISLAADAAGISQPAISAYLKKTERNLGTILFDRSKQPLELTDAGRLYIDYLDKMEGLENQLLQNIGDIENVNAGHLTIGGASFFNVSYLPKSLARFSAQYPRVNVEIIDATVPDLTTMAQKGMLDLFITPIPDDHDRFEYEKFLSERIFLAVPRNWEINEELTEAGDANASASDIDDTSILATPLSEDGFRRLCDETFLVLKQNQHIGRIMESLFKRYDCRPTHTITAEQTMTTLALTQNGVGVSLITESSIKNANYTEIPRLYILDNSLCTRDMYIAYPKNKYLSNAAKEFIKLLKAEYI